MRHSTANCLLPAPTREPKVAFDELTGNCLCEIPPPPVLPDASTSCNLELYEYVTYKQPEFEPVARLQQGFEEAKTTANVAFRELCEEILKTNTVEEQTTDLTQRTVTLIPENEYLLKRTFELTEDVSSPTAITSAHCQLRVFQRIFSYPNQQLPSITDSNTALYHLRFFVLGCAPSSSQEKLQENISCLLQQLHRQKPIFTTEN